MDGHAEHSDSSMNDFLFTMFTIAAMGYFGIPLINATIGPGLEQWVIEPITGHISSLFEDSASNLFEGAIDSAPAAQYGLVQADGSVLAPGCHVHLDGVVHCGSHAEIGDAAVEAISPEPITPPTLEW